MRAHLLITPLQMILNIDLEPTDHIRIIKNIEADRQLLKNYFELFAWIGVSVLAVHHPQGFYALDDGLEVELRALVEVGLGVAGLLGLQAGVVGGLEQGCRLGFAGQWGGCAARLPDALPLYAD